MTRPQVSDAVRAWESFAAWAATMAWTVDLTPAGRTRCTKLGSVVFGPGHGCDYREMADRLGYIDGLMARYRRRAP